MSSTESKRPPKAHWLSDPGRRALLFQTIALAGTIAFFAFIFNNTLTNLASRGIASGFGFLDNEAGFGILSSLIEYSETDTYGRTFVVGLLNTLLVSAFGVLFATLLGFIIGVARLSPNWLIRQLAAVYVEVIRNIPLLLQIFFWYFAVLRNLPGPRQSFALGDAVFLNTRGLYVPAAQFGPGFGWVIAAAAVGLSLAALTFWRANRKRRDTGNTSNPWPIAIGIVFALPLIALLSTGFPVAWQLPVLKGFNFQGGVGIVPEFAALLTALVMYTAAFIAEIVRSGIQSVSHGQTEAARALGLAPRKTLQLIIIPQAMRVIIPPLTSQYLNLIKNSSLATAIGYPDLVNVFMGTTLNQTGQAVEIVAMTMAVYLLISLVISLLMNIYNRRSAMMER